jgi:hypothetical protein
LVAVMVGKTDKQLVEQLAVEKVVSMAELKVFE